MRQWRGNLVLQFSLASLAIMGVIGVVLAWVVAERIRADAVDALVAEAVGASRGRLLSAITLADLRSPMVGERYERFHQFVQQAVVSERTARVKLWAPDGTVIYSNDPAGVGQRFADNGNVGKALRGENAVEVKIPNAPENERERHLGTLMAVYTPIVFPGRGGPEGVLEIYQYYAPTQERIAALQRGLVGSLGGGFLVLYGGLLSIVWGGWRRIQRQEASLARSHRDLLAAHEEVLHTQGRLGLILDAAGEGIYGQDLEGRCTFVNPAGARLLGWEASELVGQPLHRAVHHSRADGAPYPEADCPAGAVPQNGEVHRVADEVFWRRDGSSFPVEYVSTPLREAGEVKGVVVTFRDLTASRRAEEHIQFLAYYDSLTGLPNRRLFQDRAGVELAHARRSGGMVALLLLDLDRFKRINDTLGHAAGDRVLQGVGARLRGCVREADTVARLGGDEFLLLLSGYQDLEEVATTVERVREALRPPLEVDGRRLHVSASIGISLYPGDGRDPEVLLRNADTAMYRVKEAGRDGFQFYTAAMSVLALERLELEQRLVEALEREEFVVHYQPVVDLTAGRVTGMEALVRWQHPEQGLVPPAEFIPVAEDSGFIVPLGEWVLRTACAQARAWQEKGLPPLRVSVNLSARQWEQEDLVAMVSRALAATGLEPDYLELEITESVAMGHGEATVRRLTELHALGVNISLDDFGTGYSSFGYLKRFPIQRLKIDRSFVMDLPGDQNDAEIACAMIALGHAFHLNVLAEGVETEEQLAFLRAEGCDAMQGYQFSRPLPPDAFARLLEERREVAGDGRGSAEVARPLR